MVRTLFSPELREMRHQPHTRFQEASVRSDSNCVSSSGLHFDEQPKRVQDPFHIVHVAGGTLSRNIQLKLCG